jgi:hypothetical protein
MQFRNFRFTLLYQGKLGFLTQEPILDGGPQISVRFLNPGLDESQKLFVQLNFDLGDPVQVFTRVRQRTAGQTTTQRPFKTVFKPPRTPPG